RVAEALCLGEPHAVDDAGVVERVAHYSVALLEDGLEEATVGVEARGVEDGVLGAEEAGQLRFQLLVHVLRAADEAHRRHAVAVMLEPGARSGDDFRMVGEAEIVVGAEVQHLAAALDADFRSLGALDDALALEATLALEGLG